MDGALVSVGSFQCWVVLKGKKKGENWLGFQVGSHCEY